MFFTKLMYKKYCMHAYYFEIYSVVGLKIVDHSQENILTNRSKEFCKLVRLFSIYQIYAAQYQANP